MPDKTQQPNFELPPYQHIPENAPEALEDRESSHAGPITQTATQEMPSVSSPSSAAAATSAVILAEKSQMRRDIERILEADLGDIYLTLNTKQRSQFRIEGERAAAKIELILQQAKVQIFSLLKIIREWLLLLPGVNKFFLEQEAKIKAEKLLILKTADE